MSTFFEAEQARLKLKMKLCNYAWYRSSFVLADQDSFIVSIGVKFINNEIKKIVPQFQDEVFVKLEIDN